MPSSSHEGKEWTSAFFAELAMQTRIETVIDIGVGCGTYAIQCQKLAPKTSWTAVEIWEPYVAAYSLTEKYDTVVVADVRTLEWSQHYDFAFLGDVLEHMTKEEAVKVWDDVLCHCRFALLSIPVVHYPQGEYEGNPHEAHVKDDWTNAEVLSTFRDIESARTYTEIGVYVAARFYADKGLIRGLQ